VREKCVAGVLEDVQTFYSINNAQAGLLQTSFIISYMLLSPIFGYLGDRYNRVYIMAAGVLFWSLITLAGSFIPREVRTVWCTDSCSTWNKKCSTQKVKNRSRVVKKNQNSQFCDIPSGLDVHYIKHIVYIKYLADLVFVVYTEWPKSLHPQVSLNY